MYKLYRSRQSFLLPLLFALVIVGTNQAVAMPFPQEEALEQGFFETPAEKAPEGKEASGIFGRWQKRVSQTWNEGNLDLYATTYAWHNRLTYDREHTRRYNENAWGGGAGLSFLDEDGDSHLLFFMAFLDSWKKVEPYGGYAYFKNWRFGPHNDFRASLGFTLGITARNEYNYIPFPFPLPLFGVGYKRLSVEATYIPGTRNNGNVLFSWLRWTFN